MKATSLSLFSVNSLPVRVFHISWITFFLCFFAWFAVAPLMPIIREELNFSKEQLANIMIASVAITFFSRLLFGWLCDKIGPRISYTILLLIGGIPVILIGFSNSYESFLLFRLAIGIIGASFVITQYHTSVFFAPNIVGTANATAAGWGNLGGGITQMAMPLIFAFFVGLGYTEALSWRYAMVIPGVLLLVMAMVYYFFTKDTPDGNFSSHRNNHPTTKSKSKGSFWQACKDYRVWILFLIYGACFGIEITIDNMAAIYFVDQFQLSIAEAGMIAGLFGMMNLFARALGGIFADKAGNKYGFNGRILLLGIFLFLQGTGMIIFSYATELTFAILTLISFALFVKMSNGVTFSVVPFINKKSLGAVSGIVGAGGNAGAVMAGFVFKIDGITYREALFYIGATVCIVAITAFFIKAVVESNVVEEKILSEVEEKELEPESVTN